MLAWNSVLQRAPGGMASGEENPNAAEIITHRVGPYRQVLASGTTYHST